VISTSEKRMGKLTTANFACEQAVTRNMHNTEAILVKGLKTIRHLSS